MQTASYVAKQASHQLHCLCCQSSASAYVCLLHCHEKAVYSKGKQVLCIAQAMGDKTTARRLAEECGVPTVPGSKEPITDAASAMKFSKNAGFPVILKAAMGGGGRGMRVVHQGNLTVPLHTCSFCIALTSFPTPSTNQACHRSCCI